MKGLTIYVDCLVWLEEWSAPTPDDHASAIQALDLGSAHYLGLTGRYANASKHATFSFSSPDSFLRDSFPSSSKMRLRPVLHLAINFNIHFLIIKARASCDRRALSGRDPIPPYQILVFLPVKQDVEIFRLALVRALCHQIALPEVAHIDGTEGDVVPCRESCLVQV
jgi:hypothetical protein